MLLENFLYGTYGTVVHKRIMNCKSRIAQYVVDGRNIIYIPNPKF